MSIDLKEFGRLEGQAQANKEAISEVKKIVSNGIIDMKKIVEDQMKNEEADNDEQNKRIGEIEKELVKIKVWMGIGAFFAGIIIPSVWAIIWGRILNADALQSLISFIPWLNF